MPCFYRTVTNRISAQNGNVAGRLRSNQMSTEGYKMSKATELTCVTKRPK